MTWRPLRYARQSSMKVDQSSNVRRNLTKLTGDQLMFAQRIAVKMALRGSRANERIVVPGTRREVAGFGFTGARSERPSRRWRLRATALVRRGLLKPEKQGQQAAIVEALYEFFDRTLISDVARNR